MRDLSNNIGVELALAPAVHSAAANGPAIDLLGFESVAFAVTTGAIAGDGDFGVKVQESDTGEPDDFEDAPADHVDSTAPETLEATSSYKLGYRGWKQHVRLALTKEDGTSIVASAVAIKGNAHHRPVA